jgi:hypothetical protein
LRVLPDCWPVRPVKPSTGQNRWTGQQLLAGGRAMRCSAAGPFLSRTPGNVAGPRRLCCLLVPLLYRRCTSPAGTRCPWR